MPRCPGVSKVTAQPRTSAAAAQVTAQPSLSAAVAQVTAQPRSSAAAAQGAAKSELINNTAFKDTIKDAANGITKNPQTKLRGFEGVVLKRRHGHCDVQWLV